MNFETELQRITAAMMAGRISHWNFQTYPVGHANKPDGGRVLSVVYNDGTDPETIFEGNAPNE